jgi:DNA primase small subunit
MFNWLCYGNDPNKENPSIDRTFFSRREWSFTIEDDIYIRYQSFKDGDEMMKAIQRKQPHKIDIGAVFTAPPKEHDKIKPELFKTEQRELVFDIDMTDYDDIRTCCKGANICKRCWPYMTMAIKIIDEALRKDFAFKHILWIYSGRRGVHCWVSDPEARELTNEARTAVVDYLSVKVGSSENSDLRGAKSTFTLPLHPMIKRSYNTLEPYFRNCICDNEGQGLLGTKNRYTTLLNTLPDDKIKKELHDFWGKESQKYLSGAQRWDQLKDAISQQLEQQMKKRNKMDTGFGSNKVNLELWLKELVFTHCYPRLDANVSKAQNHLLKSPFCIHPKTGRVCVPIDPANADNFDPFTVPTLRMLMDEINAYDEANPRIDDVDNNVIQDYEKTSMKESIDIFNKTLMNDLNSTIRKGFTEKAKIAKSKLDHESAMLVDF